MLFEPMLPYKADEAIKDQKEMIAFDPSRRSD